MTGAGGRRGYRLRTGLPDATVADVLATAFEVLRPVAEVVVVRDDDEEGAWPPDLADLRVALRDRRDATRPARWSGALRALTAIEGGRQVLLDPARPQDASLALAALPYAAGVEVRVADEADPVLVTGVHERPDLRLTDDELVRLRDLVVARGARPDALVERAESEAERRSSWRGLATSAVFAAAGASGAAHALDDLRDGYGGPVTTGYDVLHLVVLGGWAVVCAWWLVMGAWRRWSRRLRPREPVSRSSY